MRRIKLCSIVFTLVLLCSLFFASSTSAQVVLTDEEARTLGHELAIAKSSINDCNQKISESEKKLMTAQERLAELSQVSQAQEQTLLAQKAQLTAANKSLQLLNEEIKKENRSLNKQRNIAYAVAAFCLAVAISK